MPVLLKWNFNHFIYVEPFQWKLILCVVWTACALSSWSLFLELFPRACVVSLGTADRLELASTTDQNNLPVYLAIISQETDGLKGLKVGSSSEFQQSLLAGQLLVSCVRIPVPCHRFRHLRLFLMCWGLADTRCAAGPDGCLLLSDRLVNFKFCCRCSFLLDMKRSNVCLQGAQSTIEEYI